MLNFIRAFHNGELSYCDLVYSLGGAWDAGEFENERMIEHLTIGSLWRIGVL